MSEHKALTSVEIKDADAGTVQAVFARFNVVDLDNDVTLPGAFEEGAKVRISAYGHKTWDGALPVGRGVIRVTDEEAFLDGQFFLKTTQGRDTFETLKELTDLQEWSYGYDTLDSEPGQFKGQQVRFLKKQKVIEVSPVLQGAGIGTRTLAMKAIEPAPIEEIRRRAHEIVEGARLKFPDEVEQVLGDVQALVTRVEGWGQNSESKEGRVLSSANRERLTALLEALEGAGVSIGELLAETDPDKHRLEAQQQFVRYLAIGADL